LTWIKGTRRGFVDDGARVLRPLRRANVGTTHDHVAMSI